MISGQPHQNIPLSLIGLHRFPMLPSFLTFNNSFYLKYKLRQGAVKKKTTVF